MDESYRKARKMDTVNFSTNLDVQNSGLLETIKTQLLDGPMPQDVLKLSFIS